MSSTVRIKIVGDSPDKVQNLCNELKSVADALSLSFKGPIPFPRKKYIIPTRRTPCGDGSDTYEWWELRFYKRLVIVSGDEKKIRQLFKVKVPKGVVVKVSVVS